MVHNDNQAHKPMRNQKNIENVGSPQKRLGKGIIKINMNKIIQIHPDIVQIIGETFVLVCKEASKSHASGRVFIPKN